MRPDNITMECEADCEIVDDVIVSTADLGDREPRIEKIEPEGLTCEGHCGEALSDRRDLGMPATAPATWPTGTR